MPLTDITFANGRMVLDIPLGGAPGAIVAAGVSLLAGLQALYEGTKPDVLVNNLNAAVSSRLAASGYTAPNNATLLLVEKILRNKTVTNPLTGVMTVYDNDNVTPLFTCPVFEDVDGIQNYRGQGAERRDRLA